MLVLHPSSRCDICLEAYTQDSPARSPHAIPCGHVFCRLCLLSIIPPNCPLCRKPYLPDRVKRLIVDKMEEVDDQLTGDNRREIDLLRRLMTCWDDSDECLAELTREVDLWLDGRTASHPALKKARAALADYQKLKSRKERDRLTIKALKEREKITSIERDQTHAIEQSLIEQLSQLEMYLAAKENENQTLRSHVNRTRLKNPLPNPPDTPIPLHQISQAAVQPTQQQQPSVQLTRTPTKAAVAIQQQQPMPRASTSLSVYSRAEPGPSTNVSSSASINTARSHQTRSNGIVFARNAEERKIKERELESILATHGVNISDLTPAEREDLVNNWHPKLIPVWAMKRSMPQSSEPERRFVILPGARPEERVYLQNDGTVRNTAPPDAYPAGSRSAGWPPPADTVSPQVYVPPTSIPVSTTTNDPTQVVDSSSGVGVPTGTGAGAPMSSSSTSTSPVPNGFGNSRHNPYVLAALYMSEYMNGYGDGYNVGTAGMDPNGQNTRMQVEEPVNEGGGETWYGEGGVAGDVDGVIREDGTPRATWTHPVLEELSSPRDGTHSLPRPAYGHNPRTSHGDSETVVVPPSAAQVPTSAPTSASSSRSHHHHHHHHHHDRDPPEGRRSSRSGSRHQSSMSTITTATTAATTMQDDLSNYADGHVTDSSVPSNRSNDTLTTSTTVTARSGRHGRRRSGVVVPGHETDVESVMRRGVAAGGLDRYGRSGGASSVSSWGTVQSHQQSTRHHHHHHRHHRHGDTQSVGSSLAELGLTSFGPASMYPGIGAATAASPLDGSMSSLSSLGSSTSSRTSLVGMYPFPEDDVVVLERQQHHHHHQHTGVASALVGGGVQSQQAAQQEQGQRTPRQRGERRVSFSHRTALINVNGHGHEAGGSGAEREGERERERAGVYSAEPPSPSPQHHVSSSAVDVTSGGTIRASSRRQGQSSRHVHRRAVYSAAAGSAVGAGSSLDASVMGIFIGSGATGSGMDGSDREMGETMTGPRLLQNTPPGIRNALGLDIPPGQGSGGSGGSVGGIGTGTGEVAAPTPISPAEQFLRTWSYGNGGAV
ncbi:hypothetical protein AMATHDRAFT_64575 [Amanita thiersii Skay4041]|uniref:RING-type domain-containing protein n=1 Tax=Amanita thiersii Skay4041 TaxID=703135 RepID=A0A2A9NHL2_9AGAR|nr:hypothetical protein AMATHDRAFT_64575 [Amanita thiersii Skay4041]